MVNILSNGLRCHYQRRFCSLFVKLSRKTVISSQQREIFFLPNQNARSRALLEMTILGDSRVAVVCGKECPHAHHCGVSREDLTSLTGRLSGPFGIVEALVQ